MIFFYLFLVALVAACVIALPFILVDLWKARRQAEKDKAFNQERAALNRERTRKLERYQI